MLNKSVNTNNFRIQIKTMNSNAYANRSYYFLYQKIIYICEHQQLINYITKNSMRSIGSHELNIESLLEYLGNNTKYTPQDKLDFGKINSLKDLRKKADYQKIDISNAEITRIDKSVSKVESILNKIIKIINEE